MAIVKRSRPNMVAGKRYHDSREGPQRTALRTRSRATNPNQHSFVHPPCPTLRADDSWSSITTLPHTEAAPNSSVHCDNNHISVLKPAQLPGTLIRHLSNRSTAWFTEHISIFSTTIQLGRYHLYHDMGSYTESGARGGPI